MAADRRSDNKKASFDRAVLFELFTFRATTHRTRDQARSNGMIKFEDLDTGRYRDVINHGGAIDWSCWI